MHLLNKTCTLIHNSIENMYYHTKMHNFNPILAKELSDFGLCLRTLLVKRKLTMVAVLFQYLGIGGLEHDVAKRILDDYMSVVSVQKNLYVYLVMMN